MFGVSVRVRELVEGGLNIFRHGQGDCAADVVPVQVDAEVFGAIPVDGNFVLFFQRLDEVVGVAFVFVLDTDVVTDKGECDAV